MNFCQLYMQPEEFSTTFCAAGSPSVNLRLLSVWPAELQSTSVNLSYGRETFRKHSFTFREAGRPFITFNQLSVQPIDLLSTSVNFLCCWETFHQLPLTLCDAGRPSINFHQVWVATRRSSVNFRLLSGRPSDLLVNFLCGLKIFCQLPSTFCAAGRSSVNFLCSH